MKGRELTKDEKAHNQKIALTKNQQAKKTHLQQQKDNKDGPSESVNGIDLITK